MTYEESYAAIGANDAAAKAAAYAVINAAYAANDAKDAANEEAIDAAAAKAKLEADPDWTIGWHFNQ